MTEQRQGKWTVMGVLDWTRSHFEARGLDSPRLDAEVLLAHVLRLQRVMLYARFDQPMLGPELEQMRSLVARRARGEPVAHLVGRREFWSLDLEVTADTLVPRPDTEALVEVAVELVKGHDAPHIADIGTGSGCIALALASEFEAATVVGTDISAAALAVAGKNAESLGLTDRVTFLQGDLLDALPPDGPPLDLLVANLPYIPTGDIAGLMTDVRQFEPHLALDGGPDGLVYVARLIDAAGGRLATGAHIVLEAGADQVPDLPARLTAAGFVDAGTREDGGGRPRVAYARWPG